MKHPDRILIVCRSFPAHRAGGMEWHAQDIVEGLMEAGKEVHVLTSKLPDRPVLADLNVNGTITELPGEAGRYSFAFFKDLADTARLVCLSEGIDIVHGQGFAGCALSLAGRIGAPVFTTIHGTMWSETPLNRSQLSGLSSQERVKLIWKFKHRFAVLPLWKAFLTKRPDIIVDSLFTKRELQRENRALRPYVIPLGIDLGRLLLATDPHPKTSHECVLFTVGRLEKIKGTETLLRALSLMTKRGIRLRIAGTGPELERLNRIAKDLGVESIVTFLGRVSDEQLASEFRNADVFLNPDQGQPAFGLVNAEALLHGCPVIASHVGAHPEVVRRGDGCLVKSHDPKEWAKVINDAKNSLPESPEKRIRRARRARSRFDRRLMIERLLDVYYSVK